MITEEERSWKVAAASYDSGKGIPLEEFNPDDKSDMESLYQALKVKDPIAQKRLSRFIQNLRQYQQQQNHLLRNVAAGVFVLYRGDDNDAEPIGTAFAISPKLLLTACHNVIFKSTEGEFLAVKELKVSSSMFKSSDGKISSAQVGKPVCVYEYNAEVDWACLMLDDGNIPSLPFCIPLATQDSDIPEPATLEKLYIYHCPIRLFLEDPEIDTCHVMVKKALVGIIGKKTLNFQNGGFPGSCGGPYMYRNKAVALHVDSVSTTKTAEELCAGSTWGGKKRKLTPSEVTRMMVDSCVSSHTSMGTGILLHVRKGIMDLLK
jgi:hypothetical protein